MHKRLRLGGTDVEDTAGFPEELEDMCVIWGSVIPPGDESSVPSEVFHTDVLFDADGEAVERASRRFVGCEVVVQIPGTGGCAGGKQLGYAVCLEARGLMGTSHIGKRGTTSF